MNRPPITKNNEAVNGQTTTVGGVIRFFLGLPFMAIGAFANFAWRNLRVGWIYFREFH